MNTNTPSKTIPHNLEAEEATLGSILIDHSCLLEVMEIIKPEHFYLQKHQWIAQTINTLSEQGGALDYLVIITELEKRGQLEAIGGAAYIASLVNSVPSALNVKLYAKMVYDTWQRRALLDSVSEIARIAYDESVPMDGNIHAALGTLGGLITIPQTQAEPAPIIPPLPDAMLDVMNATDCTRAAPWVDSYVCYARASAPMTPTLFHESAALWLASMVIARRVSLKMPFDTIYPNLWIAWIAPSTMFQKSTAMNVAVGMAADMAPHLLAPQEATPEALVRDMAGIDPENLGQLRFEDQQLWQEKKNYSAQRAWMLDEFSGLLAATGRDYNAGLIELLMKLYDCTPQYSRSTAGKGLQVIHSAYLSLLAASTPTAMALHLNAERLWGMGWWPRFAILTPSVKRPAWAEAWETERPVDLEEGLAALNKRLPASRYPDPPASMPVILDAGVYDAWNIYNKAMRYDLITDNLDERLWYAYGRMPTHVLKIAMILAALSWQQDRAPHITMPIMARALWIAEGWRESAHRALSLAAAESLDHTRQRVIYQISKAEPFGATLRDIYKALKGSGIKVGEIERSIQDLLTAGDVTVQETGNSRGGPKTLRYFIGKD